MEITKVVRPASRVRRTKNAIIALTYLDQLFFSADAAIVPHVPNVQGCANEGGWDHV
jgi:hypothetical protein